MCEVDHPDRLPHRITVRICKTVIDPSVKSQWGADSDIGSQRSFYSVVGKGVFRYTIALIGIVLVYRHPSLGGRLAHMRFSYP